MSDTDFEVGLHVATTSDDAKLADVVAELQKINQQLEANASASKKAGDEEKAAHEKATQSAKEHGDTLTEITKRIAGLVAGYAGLKAAWEAFKEGTKEAMLQERALGQLAATAKQFGKDGQAAADATEALGRRLEGVGFNENEIIVATQRLTVVTKDHAQALSAASLAADLSVKTGQDYGTALTIIQMLLTDSPRGLIMAQRQLGIEATSSADALAKISAMARGAANELKDTTQAAADFSTIIHEHWKDLGKQAMTVWGPLARFAADYEKKQEEATIEVTHWFKRMIGSTSEADEWYAEALKKWKEKFGIPLSEQLDRLHVITDQSLTSKKNLEALGKKAAADMVALQKSVDAAVKDQEDKDKKAQEAQKLRNDAVQNEFKIEQEIKARRELWARIGKEEVTLQASQNQKLLASLRLFESQSLHVKTLALTNTQKMNLAELQSFKKMLDEELKSERLSLSERNAITLASARAQKQIRDIEAKDKTQQDAQAVAGTVSSVSSMFGASKAGAVASAIVNAFAAAAGASAETHGDVYTRIAAYIAAFAQAYQAVTGIEGTEIGTGGGSSGGSSSAVYGGTSMSTPIPSIQNSSVQNTNSVRGGDTYNVSAITGSEAIAKTAQLQKSLRPGSRAYDRSIISRKGTTAGTVRR